MTRWGYLNLFLSVMVVVIAFCAAVFAFNNPEAIKPAADGAIASLSIVFGLSAAISSLASIRISELSSLARDQAVKAKQESLIIRDNRRTVARQKALNWSALTAVCLGLVYLVIVEICVKCILVKAVAAAFTGASVLTLLFSFFLPALLSTLIKRNSDLSRRK